MSADHFLTLTLKQAEAELERVRSTASPAELARLESSIREKLRLAAVHEFIDSQP